jgi:ankyrin repeat protein
MRFGKGFCLLLCVAGCTDTIHDYASKADIKNVATLVARDSSLVHARNALGKTPLHMAVTSGSTKMVAWLIEHGADVNTQDNTGLTPLHVAAWWTATERAAYLLDHGADLNATDKFGDTPLHIAAAHGRKAMVVFLIERGAKPAARNKDGRTPAELARANRQSDTAEVLDHLVAAD